MLVWVNKKEEEEEERDRPPIFFTLPYKQDGQINECGEFIHREIASVPGTAIICFSLSFVRNDTV